MMSQSRKHRRAVLWIALAFALIQLGLAAVVDCLLPEVRDPEYAAKERRLRERLADLPGRPLVLVLGSSRVVNGLRAGLISGTAADDRPVVFNLALPGGGPFLQRICLERLRSAGIKPALLCLEVLPAFFNHQRSEYLDQLLLDTARLSAAELSLLAPCADRPRRPLERWVSARVLPSQRHSAELAGQLGVDRYRPGFGPLPPDFAMDGHGWHPWADEPTPEQRRDWTALAHRQYDVFYRDFRLAAGPARALHDALALCRAEGIRVALVLMPEATAFRSLYVPTVWTEFERFLTDVRQQFAVPLIDARDWVPDDGFTDGHHLHPEGATRFTKRFGAALAEMR